MSVRAEVSYLRRGNERPFYYIHGPPEGEPYSNVHGDRRDVEVQNARTYTPRPALDREGVELVGFTDTPEDEHDARELTEDFYPKVEKLVAEKTGAIRVHAFDHNLRSSDKSATEGTSVLGPVWLVHNDYTETSGPQRVRDLLGEEADDLIGRRFAVINCWKPIHGTAFDAPLAVCDAQTIHSSDRVETDLRYPDRTGEIYSFSYSEEHRWFYYPEMTPDEALLIKGYDSAADCARFTAHTAIRPSGSEPDAPPRRSLEVRTLAFFD
jgi:hypothetical protein